jgi:hypothetical protein
MQAPQIYNDVLVSATMMISALLVSNVSSVRITSQFLAATTVHGILLP